MSLKLKVKLTHKPNPDAPISIKKKGIREKLLCRLLGVKRDVTIMVFNGDVEEIGIIAPKQEQQLSKS